MSTSNHLQAVSGGLAVHPDMCRSSTDMKTTGETQLKNIRSMCSINMDTETDFRRGPLDNGLNCWSEPPAGGFKIRGPNYLRDKVKQPSLESICTLLDVDIFRTTTPGRYDYFSSSTGSYVQWALGAGETRFMIVMHFQSSTYNMACTWAVEETKLKDASEGFKKLWKEFISGTDEFRNSHFKIIPRIVESNWLLKKACGASNPVLYATKLKHRYHVTENYLEIMCDTGSSKLASTLADMSINYASTLTFDMAMLIEARSDETLPERIWGVFRMTKPNLKNARLVVMPNEKKKPSETSM